MRKRRVILSLAAVVTVYALVITAFLTAPTAEAASYRRGSTGSAVSSLQQALQDSGYYSGKVDGIFGSQTERAVRSFQSDYGLTVDGIAGKDTLGALGLGGTSQATSSDDTMYLLARVISAEARGEPYIGQVAVGAVVLNRVKHPSFPNTVSGVIYQSGAFSCLNDGQWDKPISDSAYSAARDLHTMRLVARAYGQG